MKKLICFLFLFSGVLGFSSCGDDVDCSGANFEQELQEELSAVISAGVAYGLDPDNSGNCNAYKNALKKYLDALKPYKGCATTAQEEDDFEESIQEGEAEIDALDC